MNISSKKIYLEQQIEVNRKKYCNLGAIFLILVWSNINTGFWGIGLPWTNFFNITYSIRSVLPLVLPFICIFFYFKLDKRLSSSINPAWWLGIYGSVALCASVFSPRPYVAFYWGMAFMMAMYAPAVFFISPIKKDYTPERYMLYTIWGILGIFVLAMLYFFGMSVVTEREILGTASSHAGMGTRSSGLGRFFGVAAIIMLVWLLHGRALSRFMLVIPVLFCLRVVWVAQSRGAMFATLFAMFLVLMTSRSKWVFYVSGFIAMILAFTIFTEEYADLSEIVVTHFQRGQSSDEFTSMTGRTRAYAAGWEAIKRHPLLGVGNWADRMLIGEHVHNSYFQAAMNAGLIGFVPYLISWLTALQMCFNIYSRRILLSHSEQTLFLQCAAVTVFFFVRAIPETTTASFSVDQVIMVPVFYYLTATYLRIKEREKCSNNPEMSTL